MLSSISIKRWYFVHTWSSLICTVFLLLLCITGLPLIFHHEIDELTRAPDLSAVEPLQSQASLDAIVQQAHNEKPEWSLIFLVWDKDNPIISAVLGPSMQASESDALILPFDSRSSQRLAAPPANEGIMYFLLDLHASLLMGLPGTLFLAVMGLLFMVSLVSGAVVYAPFMRRLPFATVRKNRSKKITWLDTHNMLGIVTLTWVVVVGFTGVILTLVTPITAIWQSDQLATIAAPYRGTQSQFKPVSVDTVVASVRAQVPDADISFVSWPNSPFATPYHYTVALRGDTPLTKRLIKIAMVDAKTGKVTTIEQTPWYMSAINLSIPLHFGDYGGLPLKILWALLDIAAIFVLWSGLYLWFARRKQSIEKRLFELDVTNLTGTIK